MLGRYYYNQQIIDNLPLEFTPIEFLQSIDSRLDNGKCRGILGKLGIKKTETVDLPNTKIFLLSGGQKARVAFVKLIFEKPQILLLDEPTNHLDIETVETLIESLETFEGGILLITHEPEMIERLSNQIWMLDKNTHKINTKIETYEEYCNIILKD
jgi:ATP-binding cassette subfamily F protein 3